MAKGLIVDDSLMMQEILGKTFLAAGHEIVGKASNAKESLDLFTQHQPDFITFDLKMPLVDGIDAEQAIKQILEAKKDTKIILVTAVDDAAQIAGFIQAGVREVINKPFTLEQIVNLLGRVIAKY